MKSKPNQHARIRQRHFVCTGALALIAIANTVLLPSAYATSDWDPTVLVNTEAFQIIDDSDISADPRIQFGDTLAETLTFERTADRFSFSDDVIVRGNLTVTGALITNTISGSSITINALTNCDTIDVDANGLLSCGSDATGTGGVFAQTVTVAQSGGDYTSVKSAIDSITDATATKQYAVLVYPGVYNEAPITMKEFVNVVSTGGPEQTKISANNASSNLITAATGTFIKGFTLDGVTTGACIYANTADSHMNDIDFEDCQFGLRAAYPSAIVMATGLYYHGGTMTNFVYAESGAELHVTNSFLNTGTVTSAFAATGSGTKLNVKNSSILTMNITNGLFSNNGAAIHALGVSIDGATNASRIGSNGTNTALQSAGGVFINSASYDVLVESSMAKIIISSGIIDRTKVSVPTGTETSILFSDETAGDKGTVSLGEFSVGSPENPAESTFGEGDSYTFGMLVYTENTSSVFTNVSAAAASFTGSTFTFPGTASGNAIYISSTRKDVNGNFVKFLGYKMHMGSTSLVPSGGEVVHEYWNGSSWTSFNHMCTHSSLLYRYGENCFLRPNTTEHMRFNVDILDDWTTNDPPSLGTSSYWIRIRIASAVTTAPVFERFTVHSNRTEINEDGTITSHGLARYRKTFVVSPQTIFFGQGGGTPSNYSVNIGSSPVNWVDNREKAAFSGGGSKEDEITGSISLPFGIDTSTTLEVRIMWIKKDSTSGNVEWQLDYLLRGSQGVLVASGSSVTPVQRSTGESLTGAAGTTLNTSATGSTVAGNTPIRSEFIGGIDISQYYEGDTLFVRLNRDPTDPDDTYTKDAIILGFQIDGVFWTLGEKLLNP